MQERFFVLVANMRVAQARRDIKGRILTIKRFIDYGKDRINKRADRADS